MKTSSRESVLHRFFLNTWYQTKPNLTALILLPLSALFLYLGVKRRQRLSRQAKPFAVPVVVVGNITVGGTGKTPVIIHIAHSLKAQGINVGIISRGFGSKAINYPCEVLAHSDPKTAGDEALLIAKLTSCPVFIDANRVHGANALLSHYPNTQLILSDDGLQHYRLYRDFEIAVIDGQRGFGNRCGIPAGPLREPMSRLKEVDHVLVNGEPSQVAKSTLPLNAELFELRPMRWVKVIDNNQSEGIAVGDPLPWQGRVIAIAGIGNPHRFFDTLKTLGVDFTPVVFDDHHQFTAEDFSDFAHDTIVMTSKDAVKCAAFANSHWWHLTVDCTPLNLALEKIKNLIDNSL